MSVSKYYNELYESLVDFQLKLEELISVLPQSKEMYKRILNIKRSWEKSQTLVNDLGSYILPVQSLPVKLPDVYDNADFLQTWTFYKEYLHEQFGIAMFSRMEIKALKLLVELSDNDPKAAIKYLDYAMSKGFKGFFKVDDNTKSNRKDYDPDFH